MLSSRFSLLSLSLFSISFSLKFNWRRGIFRASISLSLSHSFNCCEWNHDTWKKVMIGRREERREERGREKEEVSNWYSSGKVEKGRKEDDRCVPIQSSFFGIFSSFHSRLLSSLISILSFFFSSFFLPSIALCFLWNPSLSIQHLIWLLFIQLGKSGWKEDKRWNELSLNLDRRKDSPRKRERERESNWKERDRFNG